MPLFLLLRVKRLFLRVAGLPVAASRRLLLLVHIPLLHTLPVLLHHFGTDTLGVRPHAGELHPVDGEPLVVLLLLLLLLLVVGSVAVAAPGFGALHFHQLPFKRQILIYRNSIDGVGRVVGDKPKPSQPASIFVYHQLGVDDQAKLGEELVELLLVDHGVDPPDENLTNPVLLVLGNRPLGVNELAVQNVVLLDHVFHQLGVGKSQETETPRLAGVVVPHNRVVDHLTELTEVGFEPFLRSIPVKPPNKHFTSITANITRLVELRRRQKLLQLVEVAAKIRLLGLLWLLRLLGLLILLLQLVTVLLLLRLPNGTSTKRRGNRRR